MAGRSVITAVQQDTAILDIYLGSLGQALRWGDEVVFIEDGPGNGSAPLLRAFASSPPPGVNVSIISNDVPVGYAAAANVGIRHAVNDTIITADSDLLLEPHSLNALSGVLEKDASIGIVGAKLLYPQTGGIQHCGITFSENIARHLWLNARPDRVTGLPYEVQAVAFALSAMRRSVVESTGDLDEKYFNGYEDVDYCLRARSKGFRVVVAPEASAYHWERSSGIHRAFNRRRNLGRLWQGWGAVIEPDLWSFFSGYLGQVLRVDTDPLSSFIGVDLCEDPIEAGSLWGVVKDHIGERLTGIWNRSHQISAESDIWLARHLGRDGHLEPRRYIFAVQNFVRLLNNKYWWDLRQHIRSDDLVVDLYGNVQLVSDLGMVAWPGKKVR